MMEVMKMSKLLNTVLDKISENNNEYRSELSILNNKLDEKTTGLIGDIVTLSGYTVDFSNAINIAKNDLVEPLSRVLEQYVIKDLRNVEMVNEQFIEKINDKLETEKVNTIEEKELFNENLSSLLNDKYLEIVKIKRTGFTDENGVNAVVETTVDNFVSSLVENASVDDVKLANVVSNYKADVYSLVDDSLSKLSNMYLNNFVTEVSNALDVAGTYDTDNEFVTNSEIEKPYIPDINPIPEIDVPITGVEEPVAPQKIEMPIIPEIEPIIPEVSTPTDEEVSAMEVNIPEIDEVKEPVEKPKKTYDVEEILKIAKSPIVAESKDNMTIKDNVDTLSDKSMIETEFDAREIVEEMIRRFTKRLDKIDQRKAKYEEESAMLQQDEAFVKDLVESAKKKKAELDEFEMELDKKEKELSIKQEELDKKINDIMPFANAVMKSSEEES